MTAPHDLALSIHRAHHYPTLIRRWRAVAKKWRLTFTQYAEHDGFPLYVVQNRRLKNPSASFYFSTGIHGDEPGATEGVLAWAEKNGHLFQTSQFIIFPCLNPWGLTHNIRTDASGMDLNRQFHNREMPSLAAQLALIIGKRFDLALTLHEDYDAQGVYIYEISGRLEPISPQLLQAASRVIPPDPRRKIDGRRFPQPGYIQRNVLRRKFPDGPEAVTLGREYATLCFTVETPSEFALHDRIQAQEIIIQTAVELVLREKPQNLLSE